MVEKKKSDIMSRIQNYEFIPKKEYLSSGNWALDYIISRRCDGTGGWPYGHFNEIFGIESSGKSFLCLKSVANFQEKHGQDGLILYDDIEKAVDYEWAEDQLGVKLDNTFLCTSMQGDLISALTAEAVDSFRKRHPEAKKELAKLVKEGWDTSEIAWHAFLRIRALCDFPPLKDKKLLFVLDSIAALPSEYEVHYQGSRVDRGQRAKELKQSLRMSTVLVFRKKAVVLMTNHLISGDDSMMESSSGGGGPKYHSDVRVEFSRIQRIKEEGKKRPIGVTLRAYAAKTRHNSPFRTASIDLLWDKPIPKYQGLIPVLVDDGFLKQHGGGYYELPKEYSEKKMRRAEIEKMIEAGELDEFLKEISSRRS